MQAVYFLAPFLLQETMDEIILHAVHTGDTQTLIKILETLHQDALHEIKFNNIRKREMLGEPNDGESEVKRDEKIIADVIAMLRTGTAQGVNPEMPTTDNAEQLLSALQENTELLEHVENNPGGDSMKDVLEAIIAAFNEPITIDDLLAPIQRSQRKNKK